MIVYGRNVIAIHNDTGLIRWKAFFKSEGEWYYDACVR